MVTSGREKKFNYSWRKISLNPIILIQHNFYNCIVCKCNYGHIHHECSLNHWVSVSNTYKRYKKSASQSCNGLWCKLMTSGGAWRGFDTKREFWSISLFSTVSQRLTEFLLKNNYIDPSLQKSSIPGIPTCLDHSSHTTHQRSP